MLRFLVRTSSLSPISLLVLAICLLAPTAYAQEADEGIEERPIPSRTIDTQYVTIPTEIPKNERVIEPPESILPELDTERGAVRPGQTTDFIEDAPENLEKNRPLINRMGTKMGRGLVNILAGWIEIPRHMAMSMRETDPVTGVVVGGVKGIFWGVARTGIGIYEVGTFFWSVPNNYGPAIQPEYVITDVWGASMPVVTDPHNNWDMPKINEYRERTN